MFYEGEMTVSDSVVSWALNCERLAVEEMTLDEGDVFYALTDEAGNLVAAFETQESALWLYDRIVFLMDFFRATILSALSDDEEDLEQIELTDWGIAGKGEA